MLIASLLWGWWISQNKPNMVPRPHLVEWDIISTYYMDHNIQVSKGLNSLEIHPLIKASVDSMRQFGNNYISMTLVQLPFMLLLIFSVAMIGWRFGGPVAGALSGIIAAFAPQTVGLAVHVDDLLGIQAFTVTAIALLCWSDQRRRKWLALLAPIPVAFAYKINVYFSNGLLAVIVIGSAIGCLVLYQWVDWFARRRHDPTLGFLSFPWLSTFGAIAAGAAGLWVAWPIPFEYLFSEATHGEFQRLNATSNPSALIGCPRYWFHVGATPLFALLALASIPIGIWSKKIWRTLPLWGWLIIPMIGLTVINKRHDFYLIAATPATYPLAALALSNIPKVKAKVIAIVLCVLLVTLTWQGWTRTKANMDLLGSIGESFEGAPYYYLMSPDAPPISEYTELGRFIGEKCGKRGVDVMFAEGLGLSGWEAIYVWHANPEVLVGDLRLGPWPGKYPCVAARFESFEPETYTFSGLLETFRGQAGTAYMPDPEIMKRLEKLEGLAAHYVKIGAVANWGVFAYEPDTDLNKPPAESLPQ